MSDKPIDLGKLQETLRDAQRNHNKTFRELNNANMAVGRAITAQDKAKENHEKSGNELAKAKSAMLEGARAVANNS